MFKIKSNKKYLSDKRTTLDTKHHEMLIEFEKERTIKIKHLYKKLEGLEIKRNQFDYIKDNDISLQKPLNLMTYRIMVDRLDKEILQVKEEIFQIETNQKEYDYLLKVCPIIYSYMSYKDANTLNKINNKHFITESDSIKKNALKNNNSLASFVSIEDSVQNKKARLLYEYFSIIDENEARKYMPSSMKKEEFNNDFKCQYCQYSNSTIETRESVTCCNCGAVNNVVFIDNKPSYRESQQAVVITKFAYQRLNHFRDWLNLFQGKEQTEIPKKIYDKLRKEIRKYKLKKSDITLQKIKQFMKKLGLNKYYEHIPFIINHLTGLKPPILDKSMEKQFIVMFHEMQEPFQRHKIKNRKNFLSYAYVLHKLCQLLELDHLLCRFPLLKDRFKLHQQDVMWKGICKDLQWQFIKSV